MAPPVHHEHTAVRSAQIKERRRTNLYTVPCRAYHINSKGAVRAFASSDAAAAALPASMRAISTLIPGGSWPSRSACTSVPARPRR